VSHLFKPEAVPQLAVPMKLFSVVPLILMMALYPLWPAYREADVRGDRAWIRRTLRRSLKWSCILGCCLSTALVLLGKSILHLWVGSDLGASFMLLFGAGLWTIMVC